MTYSVTPVKEAACQYHHQYQLSGYADEVILDAHSCSEGFL